MPSRAPFSPSSQKVTRSVSHLESLHLDHTLKCKLELQRTDSLSRAREMNVKEKGLGGTCPDKAELQHCNALVSLSEGFQTD